MWFFMQIKRFHAVGRPDFVLGETMAFPDNRGQAPAGAQIPRCPDPGFNDKQVRMALSRAIPALPPQR